jgi:hypothetical protein
MMTARELIESEIVDYGEPEDERPEWGLEVRAVFGEDYPEPGDMADDAYRAWTREEGVVKERALDLAVGNLKRRGFYVRADSDGDYNIFGDGHQITGVLASMPIENAEVYLSVNYRGRCSNLQSEMIRALQEIRSHGVKHLSMVDLDRKGSVYMVGARKGSNQWPGTRYEFKLPADSGSRRVEVAASISMDEFGEHEGKAGRLDPFDDSDDVKYLMPSYIVTDASAAVTRRQGRKEATVTRQFTDRGEAAAFVVELVLKHARS